MGSLIGSSLSYALVKVAERHSGLVVAVVADPLMASKLEEEIRFFLAENNQIPVLSFPDWETLPYDKFSPHQDIISERLATLYRLKDLNKGILVAPVLTVMHRLCPQEYVFQHTLVLKKGQTFSLELARNRLASAGYRATAQVMEHGEFSIRGSILDIFPMGSAVPFRIDLFDNEIDTIRTFDVDTQRSQEKRQAIEILPAREFPLTSEAISAFRTRFRDEFEGAPTQCDVYLNVSEGNLAPGLEYYLPLFFDHTSHLFEYLPNHSLLVAIEDIESSANTFWQEASVRYEQYRHDRQRPILEPKSIFLQTHEIFSQMNRFPRIQMTKTKIESHIKGWMELFKTSELPVLSIEARAEKPLTHLVNFLSHFKGRTLFCVESAGRREVVKTLLANMNCRPTEVHQWMDFIRSDILCGIIIAPLEEGVLLEGAYLEGDVALPVAIITESELLGRRVMQRRLRKARKPGFDREVQSLAELTVGCPVVHLEHGIGRYLGLTRLTLSQKEEEFVTLEYAGGDKLYVPVDSLNVISRYSGSHAEEVQMNRLGGDQWQRSKRKALEAMRDVAAELLILYAHREAKKGYAFPTPDEHYRAFSAEFPFEETPDQQRAIEQVIADLTSDKPMDRVVCGDVGFGKTEVALRASFLAVMAGKQVAMLVPTTLLAEQHFQTFTDRFSGFPVKVDVLSRFRKSAEQQTILQKLKEGHIDILIGTHKILQNTIQFKALGLLIIDEEHRFGVQQKEAFKALRSEIDILTLTATPIPRTLNMAMAGMRDLSIIATPPAKRLSVKTFVREKAAPLIIEAISRELHRGGQVYFLHNSIDTIEKEAQQIEAWVPAARVAVAHGQLRERDLERIMLDFYHRRYNVLVCTTIIETGIDIPTANTIIIDRADTFGLAQLHQLRGRVGRSHHQAYAFCLIPPETKITPDATKRLDALAALEELGAGFTLASHDLEIRGAGELLGESQSGNIQAIGFNLYMELLEQTVQSLKLGEPLDNQLALKKGIEVDLHISALIPESYIPDVHTRLVFYKRLANAKAPENLEDLSVELIDRFGALPKQTETLLKISELKLAAAPLGICKIEAGPKGGRVEFGLNPKVEGYKIIELIQKNPHEYALEGPHKLRFKLDLAAPETRIAKIAELLAFLSDS